jgi:hypothetical protein
MELMSLSEFGSTVSEDISVFQGLFVGKICRPPVLPPSTAIGSGSDAFLQAISKTTEMKINKRPL